MAYFAKTQIQHGLDDGTAVTIQPGDEITAEHGLSDNDIATLLASDSIEESDEFSGEAPVGPLQRVTVAEGVESQAQVETLRELGCLSAQGYHFAKPLGAAHLDLSHSEILSAASPALSPALDTPSPASLKIVLNRSA